MQAPRRRRSYPEIKAFGDGYQAAIRGDPKLSPHRDGTLRSHWNDGFEAGVKMKARREQGSGVV